MHVTLLTQRHSEALRGLLNAILGLQGDKRIAEVQILNPLREKEYLDDKGTALDVKARDGQGVVYNIEVQLQAQVAYRERSLYYAANTVTQQIQAGQDYRLLKKSIHISLTDFIFVSMGKGRGVSDRIRPMATAYGSARENSWLPATKLPAKNWPTI